LVTRVRPVRFRVSVTGRGGEICGESLHAGSQVISIAASAGHIPGLGRVQRSFHSVRMSVSAATCNRPAGPGFRSVIAALQAAPAQGNWWLARHRRAQAIAQGSHCGAPQGSTASSPGPGSIIGRRGATASSAAGGKPHRRPDDAANLPSSTASSGRPRLSIVVVGPALLLGMAFHRIVGPTMLLAVRGSLAARCIAMPADERL